MGCHRAPPSPTPLLTCALRLLAFSTLGSSQAAAVRLVLRNSGKRLLGEKPRGKGFSWAPCQSAQAGHGAVAPRWGMPQGPKRPVLRRCRALGAAPLLGGAEGSRPISWQGEQGGGAAARQGLGSVGLWASLGPEPAARDCRAPLAGSARARVAMRRGPSATSAAARPSST